MQIRSASPFATHPAFARACACAAAGPSQSQTSEASESTGDAASISQSTNSSAAAPARGGESAKTPGVLRLLDSGHFHGVAELRHRIRLFDQLSSTDQIPGQSTLPAQVSDLTTLINTQIDNLLGGLDLTAEQADSIASLRQGFASTVTQALAEQGTSPDLTNLRSVLQGAFGSLLDQVRNTLATTTDPGAVDPPVDGESRGSTNSTENPQAVDPTESPDAIDPQETTVPTPQPTTPESADVLADAFASLTQTFSDGLNQLSQNLLPSGSGGRDPIASDPGHGRAYQKFLAIYNSLRSGPTSSAVATA
jgi:cell division septation protein DedD